MAYSDIKDPSAHFQTKFIQEMVAAKQLLMMEIVIYNQIGFG